MLETENLRPQQVELIKGNKRYQIIHGGVGTFKTTACVLKIFNHIVYVWREYGVGSVIIIGAQTRDQIKDVFVKEWERQIESNNYKIVGDRIKLPDLKSELIMRYADHIKAAERIKGITANGWFVTQAEVLKEPSFIDMLNFRVRLYDETADDINLRLIDANPGSPNHFIHERYIDETSKSYIGKDKIDCIHVITTPETSKYTQETLDEWRAVMPKVEYDRNVNGTWIQSEGIVYSNYTVLDKAPAAHELDFFFVGMDPGTAGMSKQDLTNERGNMALVWIGKLFDQDKYVILHDELIIFSNTEKLADLILSINDKFGGPDKFECLVKDWAGGSGAILGTSLPGYGISPIYQPDGNKKSFFRVNSGIELLKESFYNKTLTVSPESKGILMDFNRYVFGDDGLPDKKKYDSHLLDALRYCYIRVHKFYRSAY